MPEFPAPREGFVLTHFIVSSDLDRSRQFYTEVLGATSAWPTSPRSTPNGAHAALSS